MPPNLLGRLKSIFSIKHKSGSKKHTTTTASTKHVVSAEDYPTGIVQSPPLTDPVSGSSSTGQEKMKVICKETQQMEDADRLRRGTVVVPSSSSSSSSSPSSPAAAAAEVQAAGALESDLCLPDAALQTPIGALRKSRKRLCLMLNIEQHAVDTDYSPDYMGLAELLGFESLEIQNFWERNPTDTLLMEWCRCRDGRLKNPVLRTLLDCLQTLGRQDIIMECRGLLLEDVSDYHAEQRLLIDYRVSRLQKFDCYVNIADADLLGVGREILQNLEGVHGLRLCLTLRDLTLGGFEFEEMAKMLETRCDSKAMIVLTKAYEDSDACQFLTQFAVTLDPGSRKSKLIPLLVDEDTYIPRVLRCLSILNYHRDKRLGFLWPRLKHAITNA